MNKLVLATVVLFACLLPRADASGGLPPMTEIRGGVVVCVGSFETETLLKLAAAGPFIVQSLPGNAADVEIQRAAIRAAGRYGPVAVDRWDGQHLPFIDNFANLIVADASVQLDAGEIERVLCPNGLYARKNVAVDALEAAGLAVRTQDGWTLATKPRPTTIDDWTHYLHSPNNNAVANDTVVGPPRRLQWVGGPRYSRHHDVMSSFTACVSEGGRVFYVMDEAPPVSILFDPERYLVARDAFNGVILWKRPIGNWFNHMHRLKSGPAQLPRKLVAVGGRVFVTLSVGDPVVALDGATGEILKTYEGTDGAQEILCHDGKLFLQVVRQAEPETQPKPEPTRWIQCVDVASGRTLWSHSCTIESGTLTVERDRVAFLDKDVIVCLDAESGAVRWKTAPVQVASNYPVGVTPTLVLHDDVVLFADSRKMVVNRLWTVGADDTLTAFSADSGEKRWSVPHPLSGYFSAEDVLVLDGVVWVGETLSGYAKGLYRGYDVKTGEKVSEFVPFPETYWFHHRCHRGKATVNYIMTSRNGIEYIDPKTQTGDINNWVRGACLYGIMPANGLTYAPQHPCACYPESKLSGFSALAPARPADAAPREAPPALVKGPAYDSPLSSVAAAADWPVFRSDNRRSGRAPSALPKQLKQAWSANIGGRLSTSTVAAGRIYLAAIDQHTVHALDAATGQPLWQFTAGGRVDSPPTYWKGRVLFGSADGHVYCVKADDGVLAWKFRAAPIDQRLLSYEQLESVWPVHGSILVEKDIAWFVAGRNMMLDDGMRLYRLDPTTGKVLSTTRLTGIEESTGKDMLHFSGQLNMPVAQPDILSCDENHVYMLSQPFHFDGTRLPLRKWEWDRKKPDSFSTPWHQDNQYAHLFSPTGFLDDTWWHRTYWVYGSRFVGGWAGYSHGGRSAPAGRLLVLDDERVYGFGRMMRYYRWTVPIEHHLFAATRDSSNISPARNKPATSRQPLWTADQPILARAMLLADGHLYLAGPADIVDEDQASRSMRDPETRARLAEQREIWTGAQGGTLLVVNAGSGETVTSLNLDTIPVFDGMSAAAGRLYMSTVDGYLISFEGEL